MRARVHVTTDAAEIPWEVLHRAGRALVYTLIDEADPELAEGLHARGWGPSGVAPFGFRPPAFPAARKLEARYAAGGEGWWEVGTPFARIAGALGEALAKRQVLDWGGVELRVTGLELIPSPDFSGRRAVWRTSTPVTLRDGAPGAQCWVLPDWPGWEGRLARNLRTKAKAMCLPDDVAVLKTLWSGPSRAYTVTEGGGQRVGARAEVVLRGDPRVLAGLWCWGLGEATASGFGWVRC